MDQGPANPLKILLGKHSYLAFSLCGQVKHTLITIIRRLPNSKALTQLADRDETLLIVLINVVRFFGGTVLPDEPGDTDAVVSSMNWDYAAAATLAEMFALIFQEPSIDMGRFTSELERDGEPYRWFIPAGSP